MKVENQKSLDTLATLRSVPPWEFALLILLLVTVLGLALRAPLKSFPHHDPYDLRSERTVSDARAQVETGL